MLNDFLWEGVRRGEGGRGGGEEGRGMTSGVTPGGGAADGVES